MAVEDSHPARDHLFLEADAVLHGPRVFPIYEWRQLVIIVSERNENLDPALITGHQIGSINVPTDHDGLAEGTVENLDLLVHRRPGMVLVDGVDTRGPALSKTLELLVQSLLGAVSEGKEFCQGLPAHPHPNRRERGPHLSRTTRWSGCQECRWPGPHTSHR